ncbi:orotidine-5'-phosphate decarboxylase [Buchnera aphidicola (Formosaphis micheliae)]|uniref:orotidine-5'-phosphate decarboxylase n=1 Tax=Buchnera aphidicola TaxID=9 RepID=UPI0031B85AD4
MLQISSKYKYSKKIIIALDYFDQYKAMQLINCLDPKLYSVKIGNQMFILFGKKFIVKLKKLGFDIFLDLKFHDIPNTIFNAVSAVADLGVWMISVHISGGSKMLQSAKLALKSFHKNAPLLIGITVLTSFISHNLKEIGINTSISKQVLNLSILAKENGLDGVVCPGEESTKIKKILGHKFKVISPAVRFNTLSVDDQNQIITPELINQFNIDYIIVGRVVTASNDPMYTLNKIVSFL